MSDRHQNVRQRLKARFPHLTDRELNEAAHNLETFICKVLEILKRQSEDREPPHNLPTV